MLQASIQLYKLMLMSDDYEQCISYKTIFITCNIEPQLAIRVAKKLTRSITFKGYADV